MYTFLSGSGCPAYQFDFDSFGLVFTRPSLQNWSLHHCKFPLQDQVVSVEPGVWTGPPTGNSTAVSSTPWLQYLQQGYAPSGAVSHVCPLTYKFTCAKLPWLGSSAAGRQ